MDDPKNLIIHSVVFLNLVAHWYEISASFLGHLKAVKYLEQEKTKLSKRTRIPRSEIGTFPI